MYRYPTNDISITQGHHDGKAVDFGWCGHHNQDIMSIGEGKVYKTETQKIGGKVVFIEHNNGDISCYGHLNSIKVKKGQKVNMGSVIGTMGKTGTAATGEHLHLQITSKGKNIYGKGNVDPFQVCYVFPNQDASKVDKKYQSKLKYYEDKEIWTKGDYHLLYDKALRKTHSLGLNTYKVKECSKFVQQYLTSKKPNDVAKLKAGVDFVVKDVYKESNGRIWGQYAGMWLVLCNQDGTPQAKRI